jgi:hypothetical protein
MRGRMSPSSDLATLQARIEATFGEADRARGVPATVAWLASLANQLGVSLDDAVERAADGCPVCTASPCACSHDGS